MPVVCGVRKVRGLGPISQSAFDSTPEEERETMLAVEDM